MKSIFYILFFFLLSLILISCRHKTNKGYDIYWDQDNLCVVMKHPTYGVVELNRPIWGDVNLEDVAKDIYEYICQNQSYNIIKVWVRFENTHTDKYGNETKTYEDHKIAIIPVSEAKKYISWEYLNKSYNLTANIEKVAFKNLPYHGEPTNLNPSVNESNQSFPDDSDEIIWVDVLSCAESNRNVLFD